MFDFYQRRDFESIVPQAKEYAFDGDDYFINDDEVKSLPLIDIQRMWLVFRKATIPLHQRISQRDYEIERLKQENDDMERSLEFISTWSQDLQDRVYEEGKDSLLLQWRGCVGSARCVLDRLPLGDVEEENEESQINSR